VSVGVEAGEVLAGDAADKIRLFAAMVAGGIAAGAHESARVFFKVF